MALFVAIWAIIVSPAFADFPTTQWRYFKPINLPDNVLDESLVQLDPDPEVFAGSTLNLLDLRIIADGSVEVPYSLEISKEEPELTSFHAFLRDQANIPGKYTTFVADLGHEKILHNQIEIDTPASNFLLTVFVESSNDNMNWVHIGEQQIFDFTSEDAKFTVRDTHVQYADSTARYLRVKIMTPLLDKRGEFLKVSDATILFIKEIPVREILWDTTILSIFSDKEHSTTIIDIDLGVEGLPNHRLEIIVPDINFYRETKLETSSDLGIWNASTIEDIYVYDTSKFTGHNLVLKYPETTSRYLRVTIFDQDNPSLNVQTIKVWGLHRKLVFAVDSEKSYKLYYGNKQTRKPSYDIERILPYLDSHDIPNANLGPHTENLEFVSTEPLSERLPWLFPLAVTSAAIVVGILLFGIIRQAKNILPPPQQ